MQNHQNPNSLDQFYQKCKSNNLKITPQRVAVYKKLILAKNHPSADDIFQALQEDFPNISFDTVNRTLLTFSKIDLIDIVESYSGSRRFDSNLYSHHHIHCIHCGDIIDFENPEFDSLPLPQEIVGGNKIISKRVTINVICSQCANNKT